MEQYLKRITSEHRVRPKYMAWLTALLDVLEDYRALLLEVQEAFDIERAQGAQLDRIGELVGVGRLLNFEPQNATPLLTDDYYRMILRAKISLNQWDGTIQGVKDLWDGVFGGYKLEVIDHQDMSITLRVLDLENLFESEFIRRGYLAPKPESVSLRYEFVQHRQMGTELYTGGALTAVGSSWLVGGPSAHFDTREGCSRIGGCLALCSAFCLPAAERGS